MEDLIPQFQQINELLKKSKNVLIASHEHPDGDAVGSSLALYLALKQKNIKACIYLPDAPSKNFSFLPGFNKIRTSIEPFNFDLLFCLDYGDFKKLRLPSQYKEEQIITIDHHLKSDQRGQLKIIKPEFSSTAEIIYLWLKNSEIEINQDIAVCLLTGITTDSGGFSHITTSGQTLRIASQLILAGASLSKIVQKTLTLETLLGSPEIWARALSRVTEDKQKSVVFSWISFKDLKECQAQLTDLNGIIDLLTNASSSNICLFLIEYKKGIVKASLRSNPYKGRSVVSIAKALGGGGHPYAAGFQQEGTIEQILDKVLKQIKINSAR